MWCLRMTNPTADYLEKEKDLAMRIEEWSKTFKHKKVCKQYKLTKYCIHLAQAEQRKFGKESDVLDGLLIDAIERR